jgi:hypothetical protein
VTAAERRALLGDAVIARINAEADAAIAEHPPTAEVLDRLRPILTSPRRTSAVQQERSAA